MNRATGEAKKLGKRSGSGLNASDLLFFLRALTAQKNYQAPYGAFLFLCPKVVGLCALPAKPGIGRFLWTSVMSSYWS
jgi:hypothetical protein